MLDSIWKDIRQLARNRNGLAVTASQSNKDTLSGDVEAGDVSEDVRKLAHVTCMLGLNQRPEEYEMGIMRLNQMVIREGKKTYKQAVVLQGLDIGRPMIDSRLSDEVVTEDGDDYPRRRKRNGR